VEAHRQTERLFIDLQESVMRVRMLPVGPMFRQLRRTVRDVALAANKSVELELQGEDAEVDNSVIEQIRDPLTHLIRNAIDHGIEPAETRRTAGKDPTGRLLLRALHDEGGIVIQLSDDGRGLDRERIIARGSELGLVTAGQALSDEQVHELLFQPGFSTAAEVTQISGRGVGMDVVRKNVQALRGTVHLSSEPGRGTVVTIRLPLTLAIIQGFEVGVGEETFVIPLESVVECLDLPGSERGAQKGTGVVNLRGQPLPFIRLRTLLSLDGPGAARESMVVVQHGAGRAAFVVDALRGENQTVIKPLGNLFEGVPGISGSTILGSGRVGLVLDVPVMMREAIRHNAELTAVASAEVPSRPTGVESRVS
jgi:two-component system chemotaxis sensor kinase CheA